MTHAVRGVDHTAFVTFDPAHIGAAMGMGFDVVST